MTLLLDVGNSRIKWRLLRMGREHEEGASDRANDMVAVLDERLETRSGMDLVALANVAGESVEREIATWVRRRWPTARLHVATSVAAEHGLTNGYRHAAQLGVDRWLAMLGAARHHGLPFRVVDCGSAITVDAVDAGGRHLGGMILPGLALARRALAAGTESVRPGPGEAGEFPPRDTAGAVREGCRRGLAGAIDRLMDELDAEAGDRDPGPCVLTGGDAESIQPWLRRASVLHQALVLDGLSVQAGVGAQ